jgi:hypothetical protein
MIDDVESCATKTKPLSVDNKVKFFWQARCEKWEAAKNAFAATGGVGVGGGYKNY